MTYPRKDFDPPRPPASSYSGGAAVSMVDACSLSVAFFRLARTLRPETGASCHIRPFGAVEVEYPTTRHRYSIHGLPSDSSRFALGVSARGWWRTQSCYQCSPTRALGRVPLTRRGAPLHERGVQVGCTKKEMQHNKATNIIRGSNVSAAISFPGSHLNSKPGSVDRGAGFFIARAFCSKPPLVRNGCEFVQGWLCVQ